MRELDWFGDKEAAAVLAAMQARRVALLKASRSAAQQAHRSSTPVPGAASAAGAATEDPGHVPKHHRPHSLTGGGDDIPELPTCVRRHGVRFDLRHRWSRRIAAAPPARSPTA